VVDYDSMGPSLQLEADRFLNFLIKLSHDFIFCGILQDFQRAIFPYCSSLESYGWVRW